MLAGVSVSSSASSSGSGGSAGSVAPNALPSALLVGVKLPGVAEAEFEASLEELERLVKTLGYRVVGRIPTFAA